MKKRLTPLWRRIYVMSFAMIFSVTLIVSTAFGYVYFNNNKSFLDDSMKNSMSYAQTVLENYFASYSSLVGTMTVAEQLYNIDENKHLPKHQIYALLENVFGSIYSEARGAVSVSYYGNSGESIHIGKRIASKEADEKLHELCFSFDKYNNSKEMWLYDNGYITFCREIVYVNTYYKMINVGYTILRLDLEKVNDACFGDFNNSSYGIMYTDAFGNIVLSSNPDIIGQKYDPAEKFSIDGMQISMNSSSEKPVLWQCYGYSKIYAAFSGMQNMLVIILLIDIVCISVILMILHMCLKRMSRPITELISMIKNIRHGDITEYTAADDELAGELKSEAENNFRMTEEVRIAAMKAYESQVNPHFLYNTLQMIQMMAIVGDEKKIPTVTRCLGDMLHFSLSVETEVRLSEEIENCENYFKILKLRFREAFDYKIIIPKDIQDCYCLKFLIQPFVENAVTHAFKGKKDKWEIAVMASVVWDNIIIIIKDNGNGISKERLAEIKDNLKTDGYPRQSIGIKNVYERLKLHYGEAYGVEIFSCETGTQIMLNVPIRREKPDA